MFIDDMKVFLVNGLLCIHVGHALDQNCIMLHGVVDVRVKSLSNILITHLEIECIVCGSIEVKIINLTPNQATQRGSSISLIVR